MVGSYCGTITNARASPTAVNSFKNLCGDGKDRLVCRRKIMRGDNLRFT